jgi:hypothetical protein
MGMDVAEQLAAFDQAGEGQSSRNQQDHGPVRKAQGLLDAELKSPRA